MKKILFSIFLFTLFFLSNFHITDADIIISRGSEKNPYKLDCGNKGCLQKGIDDLKGELKDPYTEWKASDYVQDIVAYLLTFLYFVWVVIIIYAGFVILTANGEEEKVSKAKKIILYVIIGMIVIFLAGPITNFVLDMFNN